MALGHGEQVKRIRGTHSELFAIVAAEVQRDNLALLLVGDSPKAQLHWILLTGIEFVSRLRPTDSKATEALPAALLGLDPESPPPLCSAFNWRMNQRKGRAKEETATDRTSGCVERRKLRGAVILHRSIRPT
jgi:hypothetical protein